MQAIARANRVYPGKDFGLIVDGESKGSLTITLEWERKDLNGLK